MPISFYHLSKDWSLFVSTEKKPGWSSFREVWRSLSKVLGGAIYRASAAAFIGVFQNFKVLKTWKNSYSVNSRPQIPKGEPAFQAMFSSFW